MILVHPLIDPVIISFGFLQIRWYGLAYVLGFLIGLYLIKKINKNFLQPLNNKIIDDFFIWSIIGVILGGRIGYIIFYQTEIIFYEPLSIFYIWQGGMSFHGGLLGIIITIYIFSKIKVINFFQLADLVSTVAPIGIFFGRIANFINVELYGRKTEFSFAMIYPSIDNFPRHPSQLYEALFEGIILFVILYIVCKVYFKKSIHGLSTAIFFILYGCFRFAVEFYRVPDNQIGFIFLNLTMGQVISLIFFCFGSYLFFLKKNENK